MARQEPLIGTPFASITMLALLVQNSVASTLLARFLTSLLVLYRYTIIASVAVLALLVQNSVASTLLVQLLTSFRILY